MRCAPVELDNLPGWRPVVVEGRPRHLESVDCDVGLGAANREASAARTHRHAEHGVVAKVQLALGLGRLALDVPHADLRIEGPCDDARRAPDACEDDCVDASLGDKGGDGLARVAREDDGLLVGRARGEHAAEGEIRETIK